MGESKPSGISEIDALRATISVVEQQRENYRQDAKEARAQVSVLQAEVERLQKVEGEREKGRVPDGTGLSPDGQTASRSDPSDFDPSRNARQRRNEDGFCCEYDPGCDITNSGDEFIVSWDYDAQWIIARRDGTVLIGQSPYNGRPCLKTTWSDLFYGHRASDEHPAGEDPKGLRAKPASAVANGDAPSDNPLTETKEGSEHV